jgi:N-acetylmuramoyl-L-alanine amidase
MARMSSSRPWTFSKIIEPIIRPNRVKNAHKIETVVLDPGHGGIDSGASNRWGAEKAFALDVALNARQQLVHAGYKVEMTRSSDKSVSLGDRVSFANRFPNSVFVSIHFNMSGTAEGLESYALAPVGVSSNAANASAASEVSVADVRWCLGNGQDEQNIALAAAVHATVLSRLSMFDRGVRHARFHVFETSKLRAFDRVRLPQQRGGRSTHPTSQFRQQVGAAIAQGIRIMMPPSISGELRTNIAAATTNLPLHSHAISELWRITSQPI